MTRHRGTASRDRADVEYCLWSALKSDCLFRALDFGLEDRVVYISSNFHRYLVFVGGIIDKAKSVRHSFRSILSLMSMGMISGRVSIPVSQAAS